MIQLENLKECQSLKYLTNFIYRTFEKNSYITTIICLE